MQKHQGGEGAGGGSNLKNMNHQFNMIYTFWQTFGETFLLESLIQIFEPLPGPHSISVVAVQVLADMIQVIEDYWA